MLKELKNKSVHIRDPEKVEQIIRNIVNGGKDKLQVVADFDRTLTKFHKNGVMNPTSHNALERSSLLPANYSDEAHKLRGIYYPIEIDHKLTVDEKVPYMVEWWTKAHDLLLKCQPTRDTIIRLAEEAHIELREGCDWLFPQLHKHQVPLLVLSAGIGDVIEAVIRQHSLLFDNVKVVSNYMEFDEKGVLVGFQGELIHVFNKNENAVHNSDYFDLLESRENIILLGDSLGDLRMADGATKAKNVLRIGFLNVSGEELLSQYMDNFDIVLLTDETFEVPNAIIRELLH